MFCQFSTPALYRNFHLSVDGTAGGKLAEGLCRLIGGASKYCETFKFTASRSVFFLGSDYDDELDTAGISVSELPVDAMLNAMGTAPHVIRCTRMRMLTGTLVGMALQNMHKLRKFRLVLPCPRNAVADWLTPHRWKSITYPTNLNFLNLCMFCRAMPTRVPVSMRIRVQRIT